MTGLRHLAVEPLTQEAFAPFGQVIEAGRDAPIMINEGTTERYHDLADVDVADGNGHALINIFRATPRAQPIPIKMMEKHPLGSQAFVPLSAHPYYVVVAEPSDSLSPHDLRCFLARPGQGVSYAKGVWHHPLLALDAASDFLVVDRGGSGDNLIEVWFEEHDFTYLPSR